MKLKRSTSNTKTTSGETKKSKFDVIFQIITISFTAISAVSAAVSVYFSYQAISTSKAISQDQIKYTKSINDFNIKSQRPYYLIKKNAIEIFDNKSYFLSLITTNIGDRPLLSMKTKCFVLMKDTIGYKVTYSAIYNMANPLDKGMEQNLCEYLPHSKSLKDILIRLDVQYKDYLSDTLYKQEFYYNVSKEQQEYLTIKNLKAIHLYAAGMEEKEIIDKAIELYGK